MRAQDKEEDQDKVGVGGQEHQGGRDAHGSFRLSNLHKSYEGSGFEQGLERKEGVSQVSPLGRAFQAQISH